MKPKTKRRKRTLSLDAEIRAQAKQIYASGMAEAYKAAAITIVGRKLDEIRTILNVAGFSAPTVLANAATNAARPNQPVNAQVENPCIQCGREGVRRTKPNAFNPTGSWYCKAHEGLAAQSEFEDRIDNALLGAQKPPEAKKPVLIQTNAPAKIAAEQPVPQEAQIQPTASGPAEAGADSLAAAMQGLGLPQ